MNDSHIASFASSAELMATAAGKLIRDAAERPIESEIKSDGSPVTDIDIATEDCIRAIIAKRHPDHGIIGEEGEPVSPEAEFVWVIDPIDGTLPFLAGIPVFGTLIALMHDNKPVLGVIDMPMTGERWLGRQGIGTLRNGVPVRTRACGDLSAALMSTSNPDYFGTDDIDVLIRMKGATHMTIYGGSCMSYAQLATGRIDVGFDVRFGIHDYLAMVTIIEGAGGVITDWNGEPLGLHSGDRFVASGDPRVHEQALRILAG
jgi:inositol-phosphate phosphatase / L-galactose 1-phosphate phosphatase / histidinol-phosphatase